MQSIHNERNESKHRLFKTTALSKSMEKKQFPRISDANLDDVSISEPEPEKGNRLRSRES